MYTTQNWLKLLVDFSVFHFILWQTWNFISKNDATDFIWLSLHIIHMHNNTFSDIARRKKLRWLKLIHQGPRYEDFLVGDIGQAQKILVPVVLIL